ncbi:MAG: FAD-dependent oxidoreductase [Ruminococcaceae bacterium]|nr:FAD-dependent oxidoreductase [Oscillospiraceae bacterium]
MNDFLTKKTLDCDLCVIGGGLSGSFAALEAARHGAKVILMQDRPMLGGNASSEIRMWVRGAGGAFNRETGLLSELEERIIRYNPTLVPSLTDAALYGMLRENDNITLLLNTSCLDAAMQGSRILSVTGWQMTTYTYYTVTAKLFMDCSGDSILAPLTGAAYCHGREARSEYNEELGQPAADIRTMGMSVLLAARETDHPVSFTPPPFANVYPTDDSFAGDVGQSVHAQVRDHRVATSGANLWWVELGGEGDSIHDADRVRDELLACIYGVWDHIKNRGDHGMENWDLDWVGFLPGKRESRRYVGDYVMCEADIRSGGHFDDEIAYGGWPMDDHNPYGMRKNPESNLPSIMIPVTEPYGIPLRSLYSKNIDNLMFAGRNISVTHVALSSTRVMGTCSLIGQAAGCAAALALRLGISPREAALGHCREIQQQLMDDGVFLPHFRREVSALTKRAKTNLTDARRDTLFNGLERPHTQAGENSIVFQPGESLCFRFDRPEHIRGLRLCFDPDFERMSISDNHKMRVFAMKLHTGRDFVPVRVAATLVKSFVVYADGQEAARVEDNFHRLLTLPLDITATELRIEWLETNGAPEVRLFSADLLA